MYDKTAKAFMAPLAIETDAEAIRVFTTWVNEDNKQSNVAQYPEQFAMWRIGTYDTESGNLDTDQKELITGNACKNEEKKYTVKEIIALWNETLAIAKPQ